MWPLLHVILSSIMHLQTFVCLRICVFVFVFLCDLWCMLHSLPSNKIFVTLLYIPFEFLHSCQ